MTPAPAEPVAPEPAVPERMRVLLDLRMASWTGVGRYSRGLARALAARDDLELLVAHAAGESPPISGGNVARTLPVAGGPFTPAGMLALGRAQAELTPDITHCLHFPTPLPARRPVVVTLHDLTPLLIDDVMASIARRVIYRALNVRAARVADAIICPSTNTRHDVEALLPPAAGKVRVVLEAADDFARGERAALDRELADFAARPYVLSMGSTRMHKDLPTLLAAFERLASARADIGLVLVGKDDAAYLDRFLASAPADVRRRVRFTGPVTDEQLRTLYSDAAIFAFPSRYEGFGLPPLEAMELGTPVVVARAASLPEVVGDAALLVDPGDAEGFSEAMARVLDEPTLRDRLVRDGHIRSSELTWAKAAEGTVAVYREVLGRGPGRRLAGAREGDGGS